MNYLKEIGRMIEGKRNWIDIWHYFVGNYRYKLYYSKSFKSSSSDRHLLMRSHIREQIYYRINIMNRQCYYSGSCIKCGCQTTMLQMANKACEGNCYPKMMNKKEWTNFKQIQQSKNYNNV